MAKRISYLQLNLSLALACMTPGCTLVSPQKVTPADEVTIPKAMEAIACGLKTYQNELSRLHLNTGGILDEAEITLVLKASATGSNELVVDAKPSFGGVAPVGVTSTSKLENIGSRDNTIHLIFRNIYTASLNDPGKAQVKKQPVPFAPGPTAFAYLDKPCASVSDPTSVEYLRHLQENPNHG